MSTDVAHKPPRFLTLNEVMTLHEAAIDQFGGSHGVRDPGGVEAAVMMAQQGFGGQHVHAFPFEMAAAYAFHIAERQSFIDGNKRTALSACVTFLRLNGWSLVADEMEAADQILGFASKKQTKAGFAEWLKSNSRPRPSMELREFFQRVTATHLSAKVTELRRSTRDEELLATIDETSHAFSIAKDLQTAAEFAHHRGDEESVRAHWNDIMLFVALYRIAEDMGYEW